MTETEKVSSSGKVKVQVESQGTEPEKAAVKNERSTSLKVEPGNGSKQKNKPLYILFVV